MLPSGHPRGGLERVGKQVVKFQTTSESPSKNYPKHDRSKIKGRSSGKSAQKSSTNFSTPSDVHDDGDPDDAEDDDLENKDWEEEETESDSPDLATTRPLHRVRQWRNSRSVRRVKSMEGKRSRSRSKEKQSVLAALLPGAEIRDANHPVLVNTSTTREIVVFNIGGTMFETHRSTLRKLPHSPLADESFLQKHFRKDKGHYFFDRDPEVFGAILNYLRTGELHLPTKFCGPAVKMEIEFWGIEEEEIEECCWTNYSAWTTTLESLRKLEKDRKVHMPDSAEHFLRSGKSMPSKFQRVQIKGWDVLNNPRSSIAAQIYSYVSLTLVIISIFSFIAQTHKYFRISVDDTEPQPDLSVNVTANVSTASTTVTTPSPEKAKLRDDVHPVMLYIDAVCLAFFLTEFLLRFFLSPRRCKLLLLPMTVFEFLALLPDLIEFGFRLFSPAIRTHSAVDVITFLRLLRVFRIFRLMRHFPGLWILFYTLKASVKELLLLLMFLCVGMLFFASLIYYTDDRELFTSIPMACWWAIITMTTVGYGDMSPTTELGYIVGSMTAICGVLVIGFTVPVLVNNFILYYQHTQCAISREGAKQKRAEFKRMRRGSLVENMSIPSISKEMLKPEVGVKTGKMLNPYPQKSSEIGKSFSDSVEMKEQRENSHNKNGIDCTESLLDTKAL